VGMMLNGHCTCGLQGYVGFGGLRANFETSCLVPAGCRRCRALRSLDVLGPQKLCHPDQIVMLARFAREDEFRTAWDWRLPDQRTVRVDPEGNLCPACGKPDLTFALEAMSD
jgi:hypothetical protein